MILSRLAFSDLAGLECWSSEEARPIVPLRGRTAASGRLSDFELGVEVRRESSDGAGLDGKDPELRTSGDADGAIVTGRFNAPGVEPRPFDDVVGVLVDVLVAEFVELVLELAVGVAKAVV